MEQTNQIILKNLSNELAQTLNQTQQKLLIVTNELFQLKKQLKLTKIQLSQLKNTNQKLQAELKNSQRVKFYSMFEQKEKILDKPISSLIEQYLNEVKVPSCEILYKHCIQASRSKNYNQFLQRLEEKLKDKPMKKSTEREQKTSQEEKEKQKLRNLIIRRKTSQAQIYTSGYTSNQRTKSRFTEDGYKLPSFRMKTQVSTSLQKYSIF